MKAIYIGQEFINYGEQVKVENDEENGNYQIVFDSDNTGTVWNNIMEEELDFINGEEKGVSAQEATDRMIEAFTPQKRVQLAHGTARVDEDCPPETINALNELSKAAYRMKTEEEEREELESFHCGGCMALFELECCCDMDFED